MKVIDNFLPYDQHKRYLDLLTDSEFPWNLATVVPSNDLLCDSLQNYQLNHTFYIDDVPYTPYFDHIIPLVVGLQPKSLMRVRANCNINTSSVIEHGMHQDYEWEGVKAAVYYVNTNDGYTKFNSGKKVDSVANRMVIFNANEWHTGSTCTNALARYVINVNFF
ncbi:DNA endonuclease V [Synechococcus phage ACG-2014h]|uniref:DNA endonuclease V n=1 Tax=Synechococcus phage ACG-2014h TaxID=1340810 RepID=V5USE9_9CAUD|nr:DNA endonuclease V [Synechococcus phage ACG-2014h]AHB80437.1 DNA endonuclease V [Synechococcus phage ACG-2014h]